MRLVSMRMEPGHLVPGQHTGVCPGEGPQGQNTVPPTDHLLITFPDLKGPSFYPQDMAESSPLPGTSSAPSAWKHRGLEAGARPLEPETRV